MMNNISMKVNIDDYIVNALKEDITSEDITTNSIMREKQMGQTDLICKEDGVLAGLDVFARVFQILDKEATFETSYKDGDFVKNGQIIGKLTGY